MIRHQFGQVEFASEHWFRLAATTLAVVTRSAGLATPAKPASAHVRRIDLVAINDRLASLILVLREGAIKQALVTLADDDHIDQPTLDRVAALLNDQLAEPDRDQTPTTGLARLGDVDRGRRPRASASASASCASCASSTPRRIEEVFSDGLLNVMEAPEFAQSEKLRRVFSALENRAYLAELVGGVADAGRIHVFIGRENGPIEMRDVSLVLAPYGRPGRAVGVVGVLGPTRMGYSQAIGTVRFVSGLMNELVDHLYA